MRDENMTDEERGFSDKLNFFYNEKFEVHITLKRLMQNGNNVWLNGMLTPTSSDKIWNINDRVLGQVRVALIEIKDVEEAR